MRGRRSLVGELAVLWLIFVSLPLLLATAVVFAIPAVVLWSAARLVRPRTLPRRLSPEAADRETV